MKRFISIILACMIMLTLVGCAEAPDVVVNVEGRDELSGGTFGRSAMVEIGDGLWYDSTTRIVYWWNGRLGDNSTPRSHTTPSPYYAPNGLPYRYNPETNTFEEIEYGLS